ncbi:MAG: YbaK/EbsC family protein [Candidatus Peregrinibacteria bacterium]|nr:YbaK/EbsC family protein [Candidatus Peregrinibacteria bacterium]
MEFSNNLIKHIPNHFEFPAYTCYQAACHRNIMVHEELKTIVFKANHEIYAFHLLGDKKVNYNKIDELKNKAQLLDVYSLGRYDLTKGTINPFSIKRNLPLKMVYICKSVFALEKVYTNDGTLCGTIVFSPTVLRKIYENYSIGRYSEKCNNF